MFFVGLALKLALKKYSVYICLKLGVYMRTNIVIDDALMTQAMSLSGLETKKAVVEEALKVFIQIQQQLLIRNFRGKLKWEGDLEQMRLDQ